MGQLRIAINGYGVIGKRVADAVALQNDMEISGVCEVSSDYRTRTAQGKGFRIFAPDREIEQQLASSEIRVVGLLDDLLEMSDVVVDCTPKKISTQNAQQYSRHAVKVVFQGGEKHETAGHSFVAQANYASALGRKMTRLVSCNTTATVRVLHALDSAGLLLRARGVLLRRATDPWESHLQGILNTIIPEPTIPSHQGPDAKTVMPHLDVVTMACKVPETLGHLHYWFVELTRRAGRDEVLEAFRRAPRIAMIRVSDGLVSLNAVEELVSDLGRPRADLWEVALWEDILSIDGTNLYFCQQVDNQAIVIPETIDAIRALSGIEHDARASIVKTDNSLGLVKDFVAVPPNLMTHQRRGDINDNG